MENILAKRLGINEEEQNAGPSVDSESMEERIEARRLRVSKRVEAQKRAERGENVGDEDVEVELTKSRKQMEASRQRITKLTRDGNEFITNIRVATDARENARRGEEEDIQRQQREKIDNEWKAAMERFDEITKKWMTALQMDVPQDLHEMLTQQRESCDAMIEEKNKLITDLQLELKSKDDQYVKELKKQAEDIDLMIERMNEQIRTMTKTYKEELLQIEKGFLSQREELLDTQNGRWEELLQIIRDRQEEHLKNRQKRVEDFEEQLQHLRVQHAEEYSALKIKLETDVQILEQQLQMMKATYQLNLEKLEYNFQVLKKRDEENTITKSQQKRKITRLQDTLNNLKNKLLKQEKQLKADNEQLTEDYMRVIEQFRDLQKKSKHLLAADAKKFHDIWVMNEEELKALAKKLMDADRVIHEQHLGIPWKSPDTSFMQNVGPLLSEKEQAKQKTATALAHKLFAEGSSADAGGESHRSTAPDGEAEESKLDMETVKTTLQLVCDESGFLIEGKLQRLLAPLDLDEQHLMRLDAVFTALGVSTEEHIMQLVPYFINYVQPAPTDTKAQILVIDHDRSDTMDTERSQDALSDDPAALLSSRMKTRTTTPGSAKVALIPQLIHPTNVVKAMRAFTEEFARRKHDQGGDHSHFRLSELEARDDAQDAAYWHMYSEAIITKEKEIVWDALLQAMDKYNSTLTTRAKLITECDALRSQNAELRHLLQQYVNSKVNLELEIPPTRVMHMDRP